MCAWKVIGLSVLQIFLVFFDGNAATWSSGSWGIDVAGSGTPGTSNCRIYHPYGDTYGNALMVYYEVEQGFAPQMWVFLTDGFFRQVSPSNTFGTSYRVFRYWSSDGEMCDVSTAVMFRVVGVTDDEELEIDLQYKNEADCGDVFTVTAKVFLEPPQGAQSAMRINMAVRNASGYGVAPNAPIHRALSEQWSLLGISSMYVADDFCAGLPEWYDSMDSGHRYVGTYSDGTFFNDGFSQNGQFEVSTHDISSIAFDHAYVKLDHSTETCPPIIVPGYSWYGDLVALHETSSSVRVEHSYDSGKTHSLSIGACSGLVSDVEGMSWAATYNRYDGNMVDGDNIQIKVCLDEAINTWPAGESQYFSVRLTAGSTDPIEKRYPFRMHLQPAEVQTNGASWSVAGVSHPALNSGTVLALVPGVYTALVNEISGWIAPDAETFSIPVSTINSYSMNYGICPEIPLPFSFSAFALTHSTVLRWTDPRLCGYSNRNVIVRGDAEYYPQSLSDGYLVYQGGDRNVMHLNLEPGIPVYYTLWVSHDGESFFEPVQ